MEYVRSIKIRVEIDTNKNTYSDTAESVRDFAQWWNDNALELGESPVFVGDDSDTEA